uniref:CSON012955 protein n=1 Tax=Culicoides sonorensis TaxID=179676 RepID=A0A336MAP8_CULSO
MGIWRRPSNISFPKVWHTFIAPDLDGTLVQYEIRDLPLDRFEEACQLMIENYIPDEPLARVMNLKDEPDSINEYIELWKMAMEQGIVIGCFKGNELVGVNFTGVASKDDPKEHKEYKGRAFRLTIELYLWILDQFVMFNEFGIDTYMLAFGMGVHRQFRYRGIATEFLKARIPMLKALGVSHTATLFTAEGTQKAAEKAGYTTYYEIKYDDCIKMGYPLDGIGVEYAKLQGYGLSK